ncbi:MAG: dethiobiotin synthase [Planctomycetota bacterium]
MADNRLPGMLVLGTDTGVGKTRVTRWVARHLRACGVNVGICKPAATGSELVASASGSRVTWSDIEELSSELDGETDSGLVGPFRWHSPLAPGVAAGLEFPAFATAPLPKGTPTGQWPGIEDYVRAIDAWTGNCDFLLVEGVGGLLCPLTKQETVADLAVRWGRPVLIVARHGLGTLNHSLLTLEVAQRRGLSVVGVLLNRSTNEPDGLAEQTNASELRARVSLPVWGPLSHELDPRVVPPLITQIPWLELAGLSAPA